MKKPLKLIIVVAAIFLSADMNAQTLQEGINHLYADRYKSAISVFEKLLAVNPNNIDASYWLGQSYLESDEIAGNRVATARHLYEKALQTSSNAPLLLVGMGHVELLENKTTEARQHFETALTLTRTKKGDNPVILNAVGRANADAKAGDFAYAVEKLKAATERDGNNPDIWLNLGNAIRKLKPGEGGGEAYTAYNKAIAINPAFSIAYLRLAKLFESQKNNDLFLENLNKSVSVDPKFSKGYYELFYYYFLRTKYDAAENALKQYIESKLPESDVQDQYLYAQLCWARKDFTCAISKDEAVIAAMGTTTKPKVYRLLADAYLQKGDSVNAKKYSDEFFLRKNPDEINAFDYATRALIYAKFPGQEDVVFNSYLEGAKVDTVLENKIKILKEGADFFKVKGQRDKEGSLLAKLIDMKPKVTINDLFDATRAFYFAKSYAQSRDFALKMLDKYPNEVYGYDWAFNNSRLVDTVKMDSVAVPDAMKLMDFSSKDTTKFKKQYINSTSFLAAYYANVIKDKDKAVEYLKKWQSVDAANFENIQKNIDVLMKTPATKPPAPPRGTAPATKNRRIP